MANELKRDFTTAAEKQADLERRQREFARKQEEAAAKPEPAAEYWDPYGRNIPPEFYRPAPQRKRVHVLDAFTGKYLDED